MYICFGHKCTCIFNGVLKVLVCFLRVVRFQKNTRAHKGTLMVGLHRAHKDTLMGGCTLGPRPGWRLVACLGAQGHSNQGAAP